MTWKERKKIEDRKIVSLCGKVKNIFIFYFDHHVPMQILLQDSLETKFLCLSYIGPQESEITFKCGSTNDEEIKREGEKNAPRGN